MAEQMILVLKEWVTPQFLEFMQQPAQQSFKVIGQAQNQTWPGILVDVTIEADEAVMFFQLGWHWAHYEQLGGPADA